MTLTETLAKIGSAILIFHETYQEIAGDALRLKIPPMIFVDINKIISGEKEIDASDNQGNDVIVVDASYDAIRTLMYVSDNNGQRTLNFYSAFIEPEAKEKTTESLTKASFDLNNFDTFELKQQIITALTSKYAMDCEPR